MTYRDWILDCVDVQCAIRFYYYDYDKEQRMEVTEKEAKDKEIRFVYCEKDELCIEVEWEEE